MPASPASLLHTALAAHKAGRFAEAEALYRKVLSTNKRNMDALHWLGIVRKQRGDLAGAEKLIRQALQIKPGHFEAHNNLANVLMESGQLAESEAEYRNALAVKPGSSATRFNLSMLLLARQRYDEGWPLFESRYAQDRKPLLVQMPGLAYPQWQGEPLAGKSLVIWPEQGFGDYIQFVRYVRMLRERGVSRLTLVCRQPMHTLLETIDGVDAVVSNLAKLPPHDYWTFVMSLPLHFGTTAQTIPVTPMPYLQALPARVAYWRERLPATGFKVGLAWKGRPTQANDANRSLPSLATLAPLWSVPGVTFISLQKGEGEDEAMQPPPDQPLLALGSQMRDFADAAAIVSQLDLVISVDTAVAHLAGAMGKPCWVMLTAIGTCWRWAADARTSPWYPSMRLFRQAKAGDWGETVREVAGALEEEGRA